MSACQPCFDGVLACSLGCRDRGALCDARRREGLGLALRRTRPSGVSTPSLHCALCTPYSVCVSCLARCGLPRALALHAPAVAAVLGFHVQVRSSQALPLAALSPALVTFPLTFFIFSSPILSPAPSLFSDLFPALTISRLPHCLRREGDHLPRTQT